MDIRSEHLPFTVAFIKGYGQQQFTEAIPGFSTDDPFSTACQVEVLENIDLKLRFTCDDPTARIYFDGAECLNSIEHQVDMDELGELYLAPQETERVLYANVFEGYNARTPLIPGRYRLRVRHQGLDYYASYIVRPKQLSWRQWDIMRQELEENLKGLSLSLRQKGTALNQLLTQILPPRYLYQLSLIEQHYDRIMAALSDLAQRINHQVQKTYRLTINERARELDTAAIRYQLTHPDKPGKLLCPYKEQNYDLPENQWLKKIMMTLIQVLREIDEAIRAAAAQLAQGTDTPENAGWRRMAAQELALRQSNIRRMQNGFGLITRSPWYDAISPCHGPPGHVMLYDARYRLLYRVYQQLTALPASLTISSEFTYQWKSSDVLYELWGFFKVEKMLISLGFTPQSGWIYDGAGLDAGVIPALKEGTRIVLTHAELRLDLYYNATILGNSDTLYLNDTAHNKPDCRLDIFLSSRYIGSLVIEFKYRPLSSFWRPKEYNKKPEATKQLIAYFNNSGAKQLLHGKLRAVHEVWAVYPKEDREQERTGELCEAYGIRLMRLTPGEDAADFARQLSLALESILAENSHLAQW